MQLFFLFSECSYRNGPSMPALQFGKVNFYSLFMSILSAFLCSLRIVIRKSHKFIRAEVNHFMITYRSCFPAVLVPVSEKLLVRPSCRHIQERLSYVIDAG